MVTLGDTFKKYIVTFCVLYCMFVFFRQQQNRFALLR